MYELEIFDSKYTCKCVRERIARWSTRQTPVPSSILLHACVSASATDIVRISHSFCRQSLDFL